MPTDGVLVFQGKVHPKSITWLEHFAAAYQKAHDYDNAIVVLSRGLRFLDLMTTVDVVTPVISDSDTFQETDTLVCTYSCSFHTQLAVLYSERRIHNGNAGTAADSTRHVGFCVVLAQRMAAMGGLLQNASADKVDLYAKCCHKLWRNVARAKKLAVYWSQDSAVEQDVWSAVFDAFVAFAKVVATCRSLGGCASESKIQLTGEMEVSCLCAAASARCRMLTRDESSMTGTHVHEISAVLGQALNTVSDADDQMYTIAQKFYQLAVQLYEQRSFDTAILAIGQACEIARTWGSANCEAGDTSAFWSKPHVSRWYTILAACLREEDRLQESVAAAAAAVAFFPELHNELPTDLVESWVKLWLNCVSNDSDVQCQTKDSTALACIAFADASSGIDVTNTSLLDVVLAVSNLRQHELSVDAVGRVLRAEASAYRFHLGKQLGKLSNPGTFEGQLQISIAIARAGLSGHDHVIEYATSCLYNGDGFVIARAHILADAARADALIGAYEMAIPTSTTHELSLLQDGWDVDQLVDRALLRTEQALDLIKNGQHEVCATSEARMRLVSAWIYWELAVPQMRAAQEYTEEECCQETETKGSILQSKAMQELEYALQILEDTQSCSKESSAEDLQQLSLQLQSFADLCNILQEVEYEIRINQLIVSTAKLSFEHSNSQATASAPTTISMPTLRIASALINLSRTYSSLGLNKTASSVIEEASSYSELLEIDADHLDARGCLVLSQLLTQRGYVQGRGNEADLVGAEEELLKARQYLAPMEPTVVSKGFLRKLTLAWNHHAMSTNYHSQCRVYDAIGEAQLCITVCLGAAEDCQDRRAGKPVVVSALGGTVSTSFFTTAPSLDAEGVESKLLYSTLSQGLHSLGCLWELVGMPKKAGWCFRQGGILGRSLGSSALQRRFARLSCTLATRSHQWETAQVHMRNSARPLEDVERNHANRPSKSVLQARKIYDIWRSQDAVRLLLLEGCVRRKMKELESAWDCFGAAEDELSRCLKKCATFSGSSRAPKSGTDFASIYALKTNVSYLQARTRHCQKKAGGEAKKRYQAILKDKVRLDPILRASTLYHLSQILVEEAEVSDHAVQRKWQIGGDQSGRGGCLDVSRDYLIEALSLVKPFRTPKLHRRIFNSLATITGRCSSLAMSATESAFLISAAIGTRFHSEIQMVALHEQRCGPQSKGKSEPASILQSVLQQQSSVKSVEDGKVWITERTSLLPADWTVVNISLSEQNDLLVSRLRKDAEPIVLRFPIEFEQLSDEFRSTIATCQQSMTGYTSEEASSWSKQQKASWWKQRQKLDVQLGKVLAQMQHSWFKHWHFVLGAPIVDSGLQNEIDMICQDILEEIRDVYGVEVGGALMNLCISNANILSEEEMRHVLSDLLGENPSKMKELQESIQMKHAQAWERIRACGRSDTGASTGEDVGSCTDCKPNEDRISSRVEAVVKMKVVELKKCLSERELKTTGMNLNFDTSTVLKNANC
jgi:hypothetical protein